MKINRTDNGDIESIEFEAGDEQPFAGETVKVLKTNSVDRANQIKRLIDTYIECEDQFNRDSIQTEQNSSLPT